MRKRLRAWNLIELTPGLFLGLASAAFCAGQLAGFFLAGILTQPISLKQADLSGYVDWLRFLSAFWAEYRWLLLSGVLALSALGVFLLYPLVLLRGFFLGFSFAALFAAHSNQRLALMLHFVLTAVLTCAPLLLLSVSGMQRGLAELRRGPSVRESIYGRGAVLALLLVLGAVLTLLCCVLQFWFLPGL